MKTILLSKQAETTTASTRVRFSKVQLITLITIVISLGLIYFTTVSIGCIALCTGILIQLAHKFYRENLRPAFRIADLKSEMSDIITEMG